MISALWEEVVTATLAPTYARSGCHWASAVRSFPPFNGVSYGDHEIGMVLVRFTLLPSYKFGVEPLRLFWSLSPRMTKRGNSSLNWCKLRTSHHDDDENGQDPHVAAI